MKRLACVVVLFAAFPAAAADPFEAEIRAAKVSAAAGAGNIHLALVAPDRFTAWEKAAGEGKAAAQWLAGRCLVNGCGVAKDPEKGAALVRKSADQGYARAQFTLGQLYAGGVGVTKDPAEAAKWYQKAVDQGLAECFEWLALAYRNGTGVPKDPARAKEINAQGLIALEKAADDGIAGCQMRLGRVYTMGQLGAKPDFAKGLKYYRLGLAQGHVWCQANLADAYQHGLFGLSKDLGEAARLYRLAAAQGDGDSAANLVGMYIAREVPGADAAESAAQVKKLLPALQKAAAGKEPGEVQYALARVYETGTGVKADDAEAVAWLKKAADSGHRDALLALAARYEAGRGVPADPAEAAKLRRAAGPAKPN